MRRCGLVLCVALAGCASSGVQRTGPDTYMLSKTGAGGIFSSGSAVKADLYSEANAFCAGKGMVAETVNADAKNAIPFVRMNSAELEFRCVQARQ